MESSRLDVSNNILGLARMIIGRVVWKGQKAQRRSKQRFSIRTRFDGTHILLHIIPHNNTRSAHEKTKYYNSLVPSS